MIRSGTNKKTKLKIKLNITFERRKNDQINRDDRAYSEGRNNLGKIVNLGLIQEFRINSGLWLYLYIDATNQLSGRPACGLAFTI